MKLTFSLPLLGDPHTTLIITFHDIDIEIPSYYCAQSSFQSILIFHQFISLYLSCFSYCPSLTTIDFPSSITSLGSSCFSGCTSLQAINLPSSITSLGSSCFEGCTSLQTIKLPSSIHTLGHRCFLGCTSLSFIFIPKSLQKVGHSCFNQYDIMFSDNGTFIFEPGSHISRNEMKNSTCK
jgi:hypothetical protein